MTLFLTLDIFCMVQLYSALGTGMRPLDRRLPCQVSTVTGSMTLVASPSIWKVQALM